MTDDVKAALARYRATMADERAQMDEETFNALWGDDALVLAHLDGEPARTAAAVAAAREEQREACATECNGDYSCATAGLTATPLANRIAELEKANNAFRNKQSLWDEDASFYLQTLRQADSIGALKADLHDEREVSQSLREQLIAAEAERDALRAQTSLTDGPCVECGESTQWAAGDPGRWSVMLPTEAEPGVAKHHHVKCVLGWRAQVEAARAACARFIDLPWLKWAGDAGRDVLAAMDGAKP